MIDLFSDILLVSSAVIVAILLEEYISRRRSRAQVMNFFKMADRRHHPANGIKFCQLESCAKYADAIKNALMEVPPGSKIRLAKYVTMWIEGNDVYANDIDGPRLVDMTQRENVQHYGFLIIHFSRKEVSNGHANA